MIISNLKQIKHQVFSAFSVGVGDLVLGTNPAGSLPETVEQIEKELTDIRETFKIKEIIPHSVLAHIDIQAHLGEKGEKNMEDTGIWFQSIAGSDKANATFDLPFKKMVGLANKREGKFGLYLETGQGADFTNGHGQVFFF